MYYYLKIYNIILFKGNNVFLFHYVPLGALYLSNEATTGPYFNLQDLYLSFWFYWGLTPQQQAGSYQGGEISFLVEETVAPHLL